IAIRDSGEHLLNLVNDLLDFAKLGAGKVDLHPGDVDVAALLRGICELLSPRAREKGVEIAWATPKDIGAIRADEGRLRQILLNFAGNAVKFTETGGVLVSVSQPEKGRLRFTVDDTGPGVSAAQRERIFEAFAQAGPAHANMGGPGLGLALAARTEFGDVILVDHALVAGGRLLRRPPERRAIILLAPEERALIGRYRRAGFAGYLIKPLRRASLAERVLIAAGAEQAPAAGAEDERIAPAAAP